MNRFRFWVAKQISAVSWAIMPDPQKTFFAGEWQKRLDAFKQECAARQRGGSEMRERVAREIEASMFAPHELPINGELHERYLETAGAAIAALAEKGTK